MKAGRCSAYSTLRVGWMTFWRKLSRSRMSERVFATKRFARETASPMTRRGSRWAPPVTYRSPSILIVVTVSCSKILTPFSTRREKRSCGAGSFWFVSKAFIFATLFARSADSRSRYKVDARGVPIGVNIGFGRVMCFRIGRLAVREYQFEMFLRNRYTAKICPRITRIIRIFTSHISLADSRLS